MFNKSGGRYLQLVVSASRSLVEMPRGDVIALALRELMEFFPRAKGAKIEKAHVVKEIRATFSAQAGPGAIAAGERNQVSESVPGGRLDAIRMAAPPWKARFAAGIWRRRLPRELPAQRENSCCPTSPEDV